MQSWRMNQEKRSKQWERTLHDQTLSWQTFLLRPLLLQGLFFCQSISEVLTTITPCKLSVFAQACDKTPQKTFWHEELRVELLSVIVVFSKLGWTDTYILILFYKLVPELMDKMASCVHTQLCTKLITVMEDMDSRTTANRKTKCLIHRAPRCFPRQFKDIKKTKSHNPRNASPWCFKF